MALVPVQSKVYGSTASAVSHSVSLDVFPTSGNLLILAVVSNNTVSGTPTGWSVVNSAVDFTGTYLYYRVVSGVLSGTFSVTLSASDSCTLQIYEYSSSLASPSDVSASAIGQGTGSVGTGTTATIAQADSLAFALVGITGTQTDNSTAQTPSLVTSWSNSFVQQGNAVSTASAVNIRGVVATRALSSVATYTTTATLTTATAAHCSGIIGIFKAATLVDPTIGPVPSGSALATPAFTAKFLFFDTGDYGIGV